MENVKVKIEGLGASNNNNNNNNSLGKCGGSEQISQEELTNNVRVKEEKRYNEDIRSSQQGSSVLNDNPPTNPLNPQQDTVPIVNLPTNSVNPQQRAAPIANFSTDSLNLSQRNNYDELLRDIREIVKEEIRHAFEESARRIGWNRNRRNWRRNRNRRARRQNIMEWGQNREEVWRLDERELRRAFIEMRRGERQMRWAEPDPRFTYYTPTNAYDYYYSNY
ncbi:uncharacterized protein LOC123306134 [Chrysoperla carnea]|uniref:uncharacterized protein LOC123306134 n=1 Tax=Chrysoperla carnea TaxID=189513 RepID=UPI001D087904|nr:uncharacterized protein LOC123306134 [Chrysoperla carnea]XP_044743960.1 uncharacterized protein LOC123306134 [Chrysoperla carnea]